MTKFQDRFPEMAGFTWGNSQVNLGEVRIHVTDNGVAYSADPQSSYSLSVSAKRLADGKVSVRVRDNSCAEDDPWSETGAVVL